MKAQRAISTRKLAIAATIATLVLPVMGCGDDLTSPCHDCAPTGPDGRFTRVDARHFTVGDAVAIRVDGFVGRVTYRIGEAGTVRVVSTLRAAHRADLDCIEVEMIAHRSGLEIKSANPEKRDNVSVDFEITAPAGAIPSVALGVGLIDYRGRPTGTPRFTTGVGSIRLWLPPDVDVTVDLSTAVGSVFVGFPVDGFVSSHPSTVRGRIGRGGDAYLQAFSAVGDIRVSSARLVS